MTKADLLVSLCEPFRSFIVVEHVTMLDIGQVLSNVLPHVLALPLFSVLLGIIYLHPAFCPLKLSDYSHVQAAVSVYVSFCAHFTTFPFGAILCSTQ